MYQLKIGAIPLPKLYVCEDRKEAAECRARGVPYIIRPKGMDDITIVKAVLYHTIKNKFPHVDWFHILGQKAREGSRRIEVAEPVKGEIQHVSAEHRDNPGIGCEAADPSNVMQVAVDEDGNPDYRMTGGGVDEDELSYKSVKINDYIGDLGWYVSIDELQSLKLLPVFLDDIAEAIKTNIASTIWIDGYNKKLDSPIGHYQGQSQAPNLIILDTSGSIPSGIAGTMISLIETLKHQCNADLIITSDYSRYWGANEELPSIDDLAYLIGGCNECTQFYRILREHVLGKHWGNVIVFGDNDAPEGNRFLSYAYSWLDENELQSTEIDRIMCFHTYCKKVPGYGLWARKASPKAEIVYNTEWVNNM